MRHGFLDIATTPSVHTVQMQMGSDHIWDDLKAHRVFDTFTPEAAAFLAARDSFYVATVSETGWPYIQHRGGPPGFLKVLDEKTLAFADYRGNRQYISVGNLAADDRAALIFVDYPTRTRLKLYAHIEVVPLDADPALTERIVLPGARTKAERILRLRLEALDWNCPQHITPRFTEAEIAEAVLPLREQLSSLQAENVRLRAELATLKDVGTR